MKKQILKCSFSIVSNVESIMYYLSNYYGSTQFYLKRMTVKLSENSMYFDIRWHQTQTIKIQTVQRYKIIY